MGEHVHVLEDGTVVKHSHTHTHENTKAVINRLSRAIGHLESIRRMVEEGRDCSEVLIQLSAVKSAINNTGKVILLHPHTALYCGCSEGWGYGSSGRTEQSNRSLYEIKREKRTDNGKRM